MTVRVVNQWKGKGSYNRLAPRQAAGGASALPLLEEAARNVSLDPSTQPVVIADHGSSQDRNSPRPMSIAIVALLERLPVERPISTIHTDLPENDFSSLFRLPDNDPASYLHNQPNVFTSAVGSSFYKRLFPDNHVSLGWSAYAVTWPGRTLALIPGHFYSTRSTGAVSRAFDRQAEEDWKVFLTHRAREPRRGVRKTC